MILSRYAYTKIASTNVNHFRSMGYDVKCGGRNSKNSTRLRIAVSDLQSNSNMKVSCRCDECGLKYIQRFCRDKDICYPCRKSNGMKGNVHGKTNAGRPGPKGANHPRWNPNKTEYVKYMRRARWLSEKTYRLHKSTINPDDYSRTLCGVPGGYQMDHIMSVKQCFLAGMSVEECSDISNLCMLPWAANRAKW